MNKSIHELEPHPSWSRRTTEEVAVSCIKLYLESKTEGKVTLPIGQKVEGTY